jgi:hypothetical protein
MGGHPGRVEHAAAAHVLDLRIQQQVADPGIARDTHWCIRPAKRRMVAGATLCNTRLDEPPTH